MKVVKIILKVLWVLVNLFGILFGVGGVICALGGWFNYVKEKGAIAAFQFSKKAKKIKKEIKEGTRRNISREIAVDYMNDVVGPGWDYALSNN